MKPDRCPVCKRVKKRSTEANRRLWLLYHLMADNIKPEGKQFSAKAWHLYFRERFLGCDDIELPNGQVKTVPRSTADLDKDDFAEYMRKVEEFGMARDVYLDEEIAA